LNEHRTVGNGRVFSRHYKIIAEQAAGNAADSNTKGSSYPTSRLELGGGEGAGKS